MAPSRREFLKWISAGAAMTPLAGCETPDRLREPTRGAARVVVIGAGYGGATAARYIRMGAPDVEVVLIEPSPQFFSCPLSNLVLAGNATMQDITLGYDDLRAGGVRILRDEAVAIEPERRRVRLAGDAVVSYDRLIVSPGIDFNYDHLPGLKTAEAQQRVLHAWKAGDQTVALRRQLEGMRDGGVYVLHVPPAPYRCPPGPYERACQVAHFFKRAKPRSKVIVLDANPDITSKKGLFLAAWNGMYKGMIEYRPNVELTDVDARTMTLKLQFEDVQGDVLNVVPPHRAGHIAQKTGLVTANQKWCGVDWQTCESLAVAGIHVLGDATLSAAGMPKSASMANQHGKIAAEAVVAILKGRPVPEPVIMNACYSFTSDSTAMHVTSIHAYDAKQKTLEPVKGAGGVSDQASELEAKYAWGWARNIWADTLGRW